MSVPKERKGKRALGSAGMIVLAGPACSALRTGLSHLQPGRLLILEAVHALPPWRQRRWSVRTLETFDSEFRSSAPKALRFGPCSEFADDEIGHLRTQQSDRYVAKTQAESAFGSGSNRFHAKRGREM